MYDVWLSISAGGGAISWSYLGRFASDQVVSLSKMFFGREKGYLYFAEVPTGPWAGL